MRRLRTHPVALGGSAQPEMMSLFAGFLAGDPQQSREFLDRCFRDSARLAKPLILRLHLRGLVEAEDVANDVAFRISRMAEAGSLHATAAAELGWLERSLVRAAVLRSREANGAVKRGGRGRGPRSAASDATPRTGGCQAREQPVQFTDVDDLADLLTDCSPSPEDLAAAKDEAERLAHMLHDPMWPETVRLREEGYTIAEIGRRTGRSVASLERSLRLAAAMWKGS